jgi:hypothetical protein
MPSNHINLEDSIALIESTDSSRTEFGSGFIIKRDKCATYWLTCAHVIIDVGGIQKARVGNFPATLAGLGESELAGIRDSYDLAVLRVEGLFRKQPLQLVRSKEIVKDREKCINFSAFGHFQNYGTKQILAKKISGRLGLGDLSLAIGENYTRVLELELEGIGSLLQPGYSGSPVLIHSNGKVTQQVIGVVDQRKGDGKKGLAISVESAQGVFQKVQELQGILSNTASDSHIWLRGKSISLIEKILQLGVSSQTREILDWLSNKENLAKHAGDYALNNSIDLQRLISRVSDPDEKDKIIDDFYWEIEKYLELIYASLLTRSYDLLDKPNIPPSLPSTAYETAFIHIKQTIPAHIESNTAKKLRSYLDYLLLKLYNV